MESSVAFSAKVPASFRWVASYSTQSVNHARLDKMLSRDLTLACVAVVSGQCFKYAGPTARCIVTVQICSYYCQCDSLFPLASCMVFIIPRGNLDSHVSNCHHKLSLQSASHC